VESNTAKCHAAEKEVVQIVTELEDAQEDLGQFNKIHREYEKDRKNKMQMNSVRRHSLTVEAELLFIDQEQNLFHLPVDKLKVKLKPAKQQFKNKKKKTELARHSANQ
jgi:hypothetical protein